MFTLQAFATQSLLNVTYLLAFLISTLLLFLIVNWLRDSYRIRDVPGPLLGRFSNLWLLYHTWKTRRSFAVHDAHRRLGKVVRIAHNHVSIADTDAVQTVYGFGSGTLKSDWYDSFVNTTPSVFSTRSRVVHTRKRKTLAHVFAMKQIAEYEPHVDAAYTNLRDQWDSIIEESRHGVSGDQTQRGGGWRAKGERAYLNCVTWYHYLTFDIISDLAFGKPFGFLEAGADLTPAIEMKSIRGNTDLSQQNQTLKYIPAISILTSRQTFGTFIGLLPKWIRPYVESLPLPRIKRGNQSNKDLQGLAMASINKRLSDPEDGMGRVDILRKLQESKDESGEFLSQAELTGEATSMIVAGSDTTSNSLAHITYYLATHPDVQSKLLDEIVSAVGAEDSEIVAYNQLSGLPYLSACIHEALRLTPTLSIGLPRIVPEGGLTVLGRHYVEGTILSVPNFTIHREEKTWGSDSQVFRPERWLDNDKKADLAKAFNLFSFGPRACIGRNLAMLELTKIVANLVRRYEFRLEECDEPYKLQENLIMGAVDCRVGIQHRVKI